MFNAEQYCIVLAAKYAPRSHPINAFISSSAARPVCISSPQRVRAQDLNRRGSEICALPIVLNLYNFLEVVV